MGFEVAWRTQAGTRTADNRDFAGVAVRGGDALCILLDGSSRGPDSGALARDIACGLIDWFVDDRPPMTPEAILAKLQDLHRSLSNRWRRGSASYGLVHISETGAGVMMHAGDCLIGQMAAGGAHWLTQPDTLANALEDLDIAAIALDPARHRLSRSFRVRAFMPPTIVVIRDARDLVLATDGFWAELSMSEQALFLAGEATPLAVGADDRSVLRLRSDVSVNEPVRLATGAQAGVYIRGAGDAAGGRALARRSNPMGDRRSNTRNCGEGWGSGRGSALATTGAPHCHLSIVAVTAGFRRLLDANAASLFRQVVPTCFASRIKSCASLI